MRPASLAAATALALAGSALAQTGLYGIGRESGDQVAVVYQIDPLSGGASPVITLNANAGLLMGLTSLHGDLYATWLNNYPGGPASGPSLGRIDLDTGDVTFVSDLGGRFNVQGLASNESQGVFYGIDTSERELLTITTGGVITSVGDTTPDGRGMAYDDAAGVLYAVSLDDNLYTIDTLTGASTLVGHVDISTGGLDQTGLAFDERTRTLYLNDSVGDNLWIIDTQTAAATLVGSNEFDGINGLAWVPAPGTLAMGFALGLGLTRRRC